MNIERSIYLEAETPGVANLMGGLGYVDGERTREEILKTSAASDNYQDWRSRRSRDNGKTWDRPVSLDWVNVESEAGGIATYPSPPFFDDSTGTQYRFIMKRFWPGNPLYTFDWSNHEHPFHDHVFVQENEGELAELTYEESKAVYDPDRPFDEGFLLYNRGYRGPDVSFSGSLNGAQASNDPGVFFAMTARPHGEQYGLTSGGVVLFRKIPSAGPGETAEWKASNIRFVSPEVSSRGLLEPTPAVLKDGRVLIVCRGSDTPQTEGRKWMTISEDGGKSLRPVEEFRYADGTRFYSPSSIQRFFRSRKSGLLYWIGNICDEPPTGNRPRFPLYIGLVDEDRTGLIRESLEVIDTRKPGEPESLALSNFSIIEDRETLDLELFMVRRANRDDSSDWLSSTYRYRIEL